MEMKGKVKKPLVLIQKWSMKALVLINIHDGASESRLGKELRGILIVMGFV